MTIIRSDIGVEEQNHAGSREDSVPSVRRPRSVSAFSRITVTQMFSGFAPWEEVLYHPSFATMIPRFQNNLTTIGMNADMVDDTYLEKHLGIPSLH